MTNCRAKVSELKPPESAGRLRGWYFHRHQYSKLAQHPSLTFEARSLSRYSASLSCDRCRSANRRPATPSRLSPSASNSTCKTSGLQSRKLQIKSGEQWMRTESDSPHRQLLFLKLYQPGWIGVETYWATTPSSCQQTSQDEEWRETPDLISD